MVELKQLNIKNCLKYTIKNCYQRNNVKFEVLISN